MVKPVSSMYSSAALYCFSNNYYVVFKLIIEYQTSSGDHLVGQPWIYFGHNFETAKMISNYRSDKLSATSDVNLRSLGTNVDSKYLNIVLDKIQNFNESYIF